MLLHSYSIKSRWEIFLTPYVKVHEIIMRTGGDEDRYLSLLLSLSPLSTSREREALNNKLEILYLLL